MTTQELNRLTGAPTAKTKKRPLAPLPPIDLFVDATLRIRADARVCCRTEWTEIVLPYPPGLNNMYPTSKSGHRFLSPAGKQYKKLVESICIALGWRPITGDVQILIDIYRPQKSGDLDGRIKAVLDSVKGFAWHDDAQVCGICANRHEDAVFPRVVLAIRLKIGETPNLEFFKFPGL